jgi:transcriptional regulator with XRE-family HTH domain
MGRAIQVVRTDRGWSRKDLAERTGLSYSFLSEIENGVKTPSSRTFAVIAEALDVSPGALLYDTERRLVEVGSESEDETLAARRRDFSEPPPDAESGPRIERSRRVLDWLSGPLARRSSGDSTPVEASLRYPRDADRAARKTPMALGSVEPDTSTESATQFLDSLLPLLGGLSPDDRELVLDLARHLAQRHSNSGER